MCAPLSGNCRPRSNIVRLSSICLSRRAVRTVVVADRRLVRRRLSCRDARRPSGQPTAMAVPHVCPSGSVPHRSRHLLRISYRVELLAARRAIPMPYNKIRTHGRAVDGRKRPRSCSARARRRGAPGPGDHIAAPLVAKGIRCRCPHRGDRPATDSGPPPPARSAPRLGGYVLREWESSACHFRCHSTGISRADVRGNRRH
jgi:hypothetical protein